MFIYFFTSLLIPVYLIVSGLTWQKNPPKKKNTLFELGLGYKSTMSIKNHETWEFSHKYIGKIYVIIGIPLLIITVILWYFFGYVEFFTKFLLYLEMAGVFLPAIPTENALRKNFSADGEIIKNLNE